jgi:hypothetical protein
MFHILLAANTATAVTITSTKATKLALQAAGEHSFKIVVDDSMTMVSSKSSIYVCA